ncbi:hypothetical protein K9K77_03615 [Candidatus Babeliales bacterium]|nr:hypothetical protein [Candidatus Babeliales bacterium]
MWGWGTPNGSITIEITGDNIVTVDPNDIDGDGIPNGEDNDVDGDGILNGDDPDVDGDGTPNGEDNDVDGDGVTNGNDDDIDGDGYTNGNDDDIDGDGFDNQTDEDTDGDGILNGDGDLDIDGDGIENNLDPDMDGDGIPNDQDTDDDGDGINDDVDTDDDGDGVDDDSTIDHDDDVPAINALKEVVINNHTDLTNMLQGFEATVEAGFADVHNDLENVQVNLDNITTLLTQIKNNTAELNGGSTFNQDGSLDLPDIAFDDNFGEFTEAYTDEQKKDKATISQFAFLNEKLGNLLAVQPGETQKFEVTLVGVAPGFTENPYIIISQDSATSPYIQFSRMCFSIVLYIVGLFWWTHIIMGYFA